MTAPCTSWSSSATHQYKRWARLPVVAVAIVHLGAQDSVDLELLGCCEHDLLPDVALRKCEVAPPRMLFALLPWGADRSGARQAWVDTLTVVAAMETGWHGHLLHDPVDVRLRPCVGQAGHRR
eukprot:CAMPEP_0204187194 /NCGR_PEP_ID=MMETSP0361-20130328/56609_1 /ASSEMBLY_ACC=CAM_ASM_000343 /TAXON_ID=268821 /ORGANISM="Scrippsiella Hangoei, Strain SHTV-5" /LENGTH=122 /DNA_ID=CAMNT_0051147565 /DNA_START=133 /DNA_END=498 /DNA_ORIENTATION=-